jgi:predicted nucleic acid-binding Zn finger protein
LDDEVKRIKIHSMLSSLPWRSAIKALKYALRDKVERHSFSPSGRYFYVVRGELSDHIVLDDVFCSCMDYYLNVVIRGKRRACHHIVSVVIAREFGKIREIEHKDQEFLGILRKIMLSEGMVIDV